MSRDRYDRDDDYETRYYGGGPRGRGLSGEDRYETDRANYGRDIDLRERDYGRDDSFTRDREFAAERDYGREDYGRGRYGERADYRYDEPRYGYSERGRRDTDRYDEGRSLYDEGRDYLQGRFGGRRRGASRSRLRCRDIMTRDVTVATRDNSLQEVARMMREEDTGVIPVVERTDASATPAAETEGGRKVNNRIYGNGKLVGLITDRDIVIRAIAEGKDPATTRAEEVMTTDIHTAKPNDRVIDAIRKMGDKQVRRIPVVGEQGSLRGIISMADVALETEEDQELADALEEISSGSSFWSKIFG